MVLRRDVQYFLRAYEFDAKIIYVILMCKLYEGFFVKFSVVSAAILLFSMASKVLDARELARKYAFDERLTINKLFNTEKAGDDCKYGNT